MDMAIPQSSTLATQDTASDATRRNFAETFGRVVDRTIQRNMDVQPTLEIRPGYNSMWSSIRTSCFRAPTKVDGRMVYGWIEVYLPLSDPSSS